jgi:hypothetical protein
MGTTLRIDSLFMGATFMYAWVPRSPLHHCHGCHVYVCMGATFTIAPLSWVPRSPFMGATWVPWVPRSHLLICDVS